MGSAHGAAEPEILTTGRPRKPNSDRTVPGLAARRGALAALDAVLLGGEMLDDSAPIGTPAERAEARGLADLTLRRLGQIDDVLSRFVDRPPKGSGQQILRLMTTELLFAGNAPHAAVDMGVRLTRAGRGTSRLSGLVNAVGRRLAEQGAEIVAGQDPAKLNMPRWLRQHLTRDWGGKIANALAEAHLTPALHDLTLRNPDEVPGLQASVLPTGSLRLHGRPQISALPGYEEGQWWVQDAAAALPVRLLGDVRGKRVLDLCAAPGGKTMQLAAAGAEVTALDRSDRRLERLAENLTRTKLTAETVVADALDWTPDQPFDAILLDAPCSATGTLRRHPDLAHRGKIDLTELIGLQDTLLDQAYGWLAPNGTLVFCTCSLFKAEGEERITAFLGRHTDAKPLALGAEDQVPTDLVTKDGWLRTRPDMWADHGGIDGFFAARIAKS